MNNISNNLKTPIKSILILLLVFYLIACQKEKIPEPSITQRNEQLDVLKKFWRAAEKNDLAEAEKFMTKTPDDYVLSWDPCSRSRRGSNPSFMSNSTARYIVSLKEPQRGIMENTADLNKKGVESFAKEISLNDYKIIEVIRQKEEGKEAVITLIYEYMGLPAWDETANAGEIYNAMIENERKRREEAKNRGELEVNANKSRTDSKNKQRMFSQLDFVMYKEENGWKIFDITPDYRLTNKYFAMKIPCDVRR